MSGESSSRSQIGIPDVQQELLKALVATANPSCWYSSRGAR